MNELCFITYGQVYEFSHNCSILYCKYMREGQLANNKITSTSITIPINLCFINANSTYASSFTIDVYEAVLMQVSVSRPLSLPYSSSTYILSALEAYSKWRQINVFIIIIIIIIITTMCRLPHIV